MFFLYLFSSILFICLQDFEALTPNLLARTIETVEGGGLIVVLLRSMSSLKQLYTMTMVRYLKKNNYLINAFSHIFMKNLN